MAQEHKVLRYPYAAMNGIAIGCYYIGRYFISNGKKYLCIAFSLFFFLSCCSFTSAVFPEQAAMSVTQAETLSDAEETVSAEDVAISESAMNVTAAVSDTAALAADDAEIPLSEYDSDEDLDAMDAYSLEDILEDGAYTIPAADETADALDDTEEYVFDSSDWRLLLVNKQHPIPDDYSFSLGIIKGSMQCDERIIPDLLAMMQAAKDDGVDLVICSPYRNYSRQVMLFERKIKLYMNQGYSYLEAYKIASQSVTIPGASEHEIGLGLDIFSSSYMTLDEGFADTPAGQWLAAHSYEYGFVLRYPEGKESITSIEYEPWHFRYVGKEAATVMKQENLCLEEFWDKYL